MKRRKVNAHIYSLGGEIREITLIGRDVLFGHPIPNSYIAEYEGAVCTAHFDQASQEFYLDDRYALVKEETACRF